MGFYVAYSDMNHMSIDAIAVSEDEVDAMVLHNFREDVRFKAKINTDGKGIEINTPYGICLAGIVTGEMLTILQGVKDKYVK